MSRDVSARPTGPSLVDERISDLPDHIRKMTGDIVTKVCTRCEKKKKLNEFYDHKATRDGKQSWCKKCTNEYKRKERARTDNKYHRQYMKDRQEALGRLVEAHKAEFRTYLDEARERSKEKEEAEA